MWTLYKKDDSTENFSDNQGDIFSFSGKKLNPLIFSNGKTQEDVVKEVLNSISSGEKIIFIKGVCGSGKSAIALNLAKHFKKTAIVVPIKSLQDQYEKDYTEKNFVLKEDGKKLKISVIKGRNNFPCAFDKGTNADGEYLPCDIELRERNMQKILEYIELNKEVRKEDFSSVSDVRRVSVAAACPHWSPIYSAESSAKVLNKARKRKYLGVSGREYALFERSKGCPYYQQFHAYLDADVLIFNSMKYHIETAIGRKPKTDLDIIDECDEFLDSFAQEKKINLQRLISSLQNLIPDDLKSKQAIKEIILLANRVIAMSSEEIKKLPETLMFDLHYMQI